MPKKKTTKNADAPRPRMEHSEWTGTVVTCPLCTHWREHTTTIAGAWRALYHHLQDSHDSPRAAQLATHARRNGWFAAARDAERSA